MSKDAKRSRAAASQPRRPLDPLVAEAIERSARAGLTPVDAEVCRLLEILAGERGIGRILEMGRGVGATTICLARGAAKAEVVSVGRSDRHLEETRELLRRAGVESRVTLRWGDLLTSISDLEGRFDLIHLRADPGEVIRLADRLLPTLEVGGLLVVQGLTPADESRSEQAGAVAGYLLMHPQLDSQSLALGEGVLLARKKAPLVTELGGPF